MSSSREGMVFSALLRSSLPAVGPAWSRTAAAKRREGESRCLAPGRITAPAVGGGRLSPRSQAWGTPGSHAGFLYSTRYLSEVRMNFSIPLGKGPMSFVAKPPLQRSRRQFSFPDNPIQKEMIYNQDLQSCVEVAVPGMRTPGAG